MGSSFAGYHNPQLEPGPDPAEEAAKYMQLKSLAQGQQGQQQAMQMQAIQLQQAQQAQKDQLAMTTAMHEWDGKDINQLPGLMLKHGASAQTVMSTKTGIIKQQQDIANLSKDQLANEKIKNDYFAQQIANVKGLPPEQQPAAFEAAKADAIQKGHLDPQQAQGMQYQGPQQLDVMEKSLLGHSGALESALKGAEAQKNTAQTAEANTQTELTKANTSKIKAEMDFYQKKGLAPGIPLDAQEAADWMGKNPGKGPSDFMAYKAKLVPAFNFNLQQGAGSAAPAPKAADGTPLTGDDLLKSFGAKGAIVKAIAEGRQTMPSSFAMKTPYWQDVVTKLYQYDPNFSEQRAQVRKAFTTGKAGDNIGSLNTATVHLDALGEAAKALDNGSFTPGNAVYNSVSKLFGAKAPTDFASVKAAVAGEMANAMKGNATDIEIRTIGTALEAANSPKQLAGVVDHFLGLNYQKLNTYKERLEQQIPGDMTYSPVLPSAAKVFAKHGIGDQPATINTPVKPGGFDWNAHPKVN